MARPMMAYLLIRSLNNPTILIIRAIGGTKTTMIPPRNPNAAPHVEPETFNIAGSIGIQGTIARAIPIFPNSDDCFFCIILITVYINFRRMGRYPCPCGSLFVNYQCPFSRHSLGDTLRRGNQIDHPTATEQGRMDRKSKIGNMLLSPSFKASILCNDFFSVTGSKKTCYK